MVVAKRLLDESRRPRLDAKADRAHDGACSAPRSITDQLVCAPPAPLVLAWRLCLRLRFEFEGQSVNLTGKLERNIVAILQQRHSGAGVLADIEAFILGESDRSGVLQ